MTTYVVLKRLADNLYVLTSQYGQQVWPIVKLRKAVACAACWTTCPKGSRAFSPVTNGNNRMHRICYVCMTQSLPGGRRLQSPRLPGRRAPKLSSDRGAQGGRSTDETGLSAASARGGNKLTAGHPLARRTKP